MRISRLIILGATLPLMAGFAFFGASQSVMAQGLQYSGPGVPDTTPIGAPSMPVAGTPGVTGDMTRMAQLEQQVRELTNQIEQRDFQIRQLQEKFDKYTADTNQRIQSLEAHGASAVPATPTAPESYTGPESSPPAPAPVTNGAAPTSDAGPVSGTLDDANGAFKPTSTPQLGQITEPASGGTDGAITSGKPQGGTGTQSAAQAYDQAFSYLQQTNYQDAQTAFTNFLKTYPTHPLAANAQYWLGESYFAQTQYSLAAKTFAKAFQDHPQGQKAPDSLLKLAMTLDKMNKRPDACLTLGELTKRFPSGPASVLRRGQEEAQRMSCAS